MSNFKNILFFIIIIIQLISLLCQNENSFIRNLTIGEEGEQKFQFSFISSDFQKKNILHIQSKPGYFSNPGYIYASFDEGISLDNRSFSSQEIGTNNLFIYFQNDKPAGSLFIIIKNPRKEVIYISLSANFISRIELNNEIKKAKFKLSHNSLVYYKVPDDIKYETIMFYGIGEDWNFFNMEGHYKTISGSTGEIKFNQILETGHGAIVNINEIGAGSEITINITSDSDGIERKVEIGYEIVDQNITYNRTVNLLEHIYGITKTSQSCYKADDININKHPVMLINALTQAVSLVVYFNNGTKHYSQDGFHNSYIRLLDSLNDTNYFCIKKYTPKDKEEELGETSYNFQIYYEDELINNQMFIMPLANGRIYTHTLSKGNIMVYRHSVYGGYSNESKIIYSANLLKIRGNPKLYGYTCNTYPNCKIEKDTPYLEEIERINQYYVNKRENATGNIFEDINGESVAEIRNQYLSVVICDTDESDPNFGECKYTIEINNQGDDVQLTPERVYATSIIPGTNYFSVKISNHKDIKKLNISLTVLTGNAYMKVYSDYYNTIEINNYEHHRVFRKEVFEFKSGDIIERYWGGLFCTEPSFIELKYVTDFHFKGYIMTNPGEINIEFINRKGSLFPYEIMNPYIYLPLNTNKDKNKDYYFKIRTKECSMLYNYNYNDMPKTKTVDMQFNRNEPYTYLTSFAFMSTVDNYNYNTNDNSTDCTMFVYNGEVDSNERPLLILSDYPIPSDLEYINYIYPFILTEDFKGLILEIRFVDKQNGKPSYSVSLSLKDNIIIDKKAITGDDLIIIDPKNISLDCGNNLQCALKIQIKKNIESDKAYNLTVKVNPSGSSYSQMLDTSDTTTKLFIQKGENKTVKVSIGKNEETDIKLNFGSGTCQIRAILILKNQTTLNDSYNFEDESYNIIKYDTNNRLLRITKEQSEICDGGCELIILIEANNFDSDYIEISITKSPILQEKKKKKLKGGIIALIVIACVIVVAAALFAVYYFWLKNIFTQMARAEGEFSHQNNKYDNAFKPPPTNSNNNANSKEQFNTNK